MFVPTHLFPDKVGDSDEESEDASCKEKMSWSYIVLCCRKLDCI